MDYLYAFLGGVTAKMYDDMYDNGMIGGHFQEILKGSQWILLTLLSYNDFNFALLNYIGNALNAINNWSQWNYSYERALLWLAPLFLIISFSTRSMLNIYDILYISVFFLTMCLEPLFITEESSTRKLYTRILSTVGGIIGILLGLYFGIKMCCIKIGFYSIGYCLVSSGFQIYLLTRSAA
jgi:hypothetical protein